MFGRQRTLSKAAGGWLRDTAAIIGKSKSMPDGELTALLISQQSRAVVHVEKEAFEALIRLRGSLAKASGASAVAYSIGLLTLSNMLSALSASGMEIERSAFGHVSLLLIGITNLWWATTFTKVCYITTWFGWRLKSSSPPDRAVMLLRFPDAFPYFVFFPGVRGYPKDIWPVRSGNYELAPLILIILGMLIFASGAIALNVALAVEVWLSDYPTPATARLTVAGSIVLSLLGLSIPRFNDFKVKYNHYGLTNLMTSMSAERKEVAHVRIATLRARAVEEGPPAE
jgi:hypothetical protein